MASPPRKKCKSPCNPVDTVKPIIDILEELATLSETQPQPVLSDSPGSSEESWSDISDEEDNFDVARREGRVGGSNEKCNEDMAFRRSRRASPAVHNRMDASDKLAIELVIANLRSRFLSLGMGAGAKSTEEQTALDCVSAAIMSEEIASRRLSSALTRNFGITRKQQLRGLSLLRHTAKSGKIQLRIPRQAHSYGAKAKKNLDFVFRWFHDDCPLIEIDKTRRNAYRKKIVKVAGKRRRLSCQRRIMNATKCQAAQSFLQSAAYASWKKQNPSMSLPLKTVQRCICACMKPATVTECACPTCVEFRYLIKAWRQQRTQWHRDPCTCDGCTGPRFTAYMTASESTSAFLNEVLCTRRPLPHLALPHLPDHIPEFFSLCCCMKTERHPAHCTQCTYCGWERMFYKFFDCVERSSQPATWMKWQATSLQNKDDVRPVLRECTGTRRELVDSIISKYREFAYHRWINEMARHMEKIDVQTFDGKKEAIVKTDFAAGVCLL